MPFKKHCYLFILYSSSISYPFKFLYQYINTLSCPPIKIYKTFLKLILLIGCPNLEYLIDICLFSEVSILDEQLTTGLLTMDLDRMIDF